MGTEQQFYSLSSLQKGTHGGIPLQSLVSQEQFVQAQSASLKLQRHTGLITQWQYI